MYEFRGKRVGKIILYKYFKYLLENVENIVSNIKGEN